MLDNKLNKNHFKKSPQELSQISLDLLKPVSHFIPFGREIITIYEDSIKYKDTILEARRVSAFNAVMNKLINNDKLSAEDVKSLIDKDTISLITDLHMQAMQTQSEKLRLSLGLIYAEYLKCHDKKSKKSEYLRMFNAIKQLTEADFNVFYNIMQFYNNDYEAIMHKESYLQLNRNCINHPQSLAAYLANQTGYDFDLLETSCHQLITENFFFSDMRGTSEGGGVQFQVSYFSKIVFKLFKEAELLYN